MNFKIKGFLTAIASLGLLAGGLTVPAQAAGQGIDLVDTNDTLSGSVISGYAAGTTLRLAIISNMGTVTWTNNGSGAALVSNAGNTAQGVWLEGTQDQLNAAMSEISVNKPCAGSYKIYAEVSDNGFLKDPVTGHLFQHSPSVSGFNDAITAAQATPLVSGGTNTFGYVATVTSSIENIIVSNFLTQDDWLGASDQAVEGDWTWLSGPEAGTVFYRGRGDQGGAAVDGKYNNWNPNEPNDSGSDEDIAQIYSNGFWNDINDGSRYYTIEWGGMQGDDLSQVQVVSDFVDISVVGAFNGSGTEADPYLIPDATALHAVSGCGSDTAYFKQTANITLPSDWAGEQDFRGHYNGSNKKITFGANTVATHNEFGVWANSNGNGSFENMDLNGTIDSNGYARIGMLFGSGSASVSNSKFSGSIIVSAGRWDYGSVAGEGSSNISNVTSTVSFTGSDAAGEIGGLVGYYWGTMNNSSWDGTMTLTGDGNAIGGLVGATDCADIYGSKSLGTITVTGSGSNIGGLAGYFCGEVSNSSSSVDIVATNASNIGGVAGRADGNFYRVAAFGDVSGNDAVGGLFGWASYNTTEDAFARGNVVAQMSGGSLVGSIENYDFYRAYGTGTVSAPTSRGAFGQFNNSYLERIHWVPEQSTVDEPGSLENGEVPFTLVDAKNIAYYDADGWNISADWQSSYDNEGTWSICSGFNDGYPFLTYLYSSNPCAPDLTNATAPTITGTGAVGKRLAMNKGNWDSGVTFSYQWKLNGENVAGATSSTYTPVSADIGKVVTVELTGAKAGFKTAVKLSTNSVVVSAATVIVIPNSEIVVGGFRGNAWWIPAGFVQAIRAGVKAHSKATAVTCVGIVAPGGSKAWQKTLGLKRAALACSTAKLFNGKLKTTLSWKVAATGDAVQRGASLKFNK